MKIKLLTATLLCSSLSIAQFSRTFFNTDQTQSFEETFALKDGANNLLFHVYEDTLNNDIDLKIGYVNDLGDLLSVTKVILNSNIIDARPKVTGVIKNSDGSFTLGVLNKIGNNSKISFYNILNGVVTDSYLFSDLLNNGYLKSLEINGEIVTYVVSSTQGLIRLSSPSMNLNNFSTEVVDVSNVVTTSYLGGNKVVEQIVVNGKEFTAFSNGKVYKRTAVNSYQTVQFAGVSTNFNIELLSQGNTLLFFYKDKYLKFDENLNLIETNFLSIPYIDAVGSYKSIEGYANGTSIYLIYRASQSNGVVVKLDSQMQLLDSLIYSKGFYINSLFVDNNEFLISGTMNISTGGLINANNQSLGNFTSSFLMKTSDLLSDLNVIEFSQKFMYNNIEAYVRNGFGLFYGDNTTAGFKINNNDTLSSAMFFSENYLVGLNNNDEVVGVQGNGIYNDLNYMVGPSSNTYGDFDVYTAKYNRGYYVTKDMIVDHLNNLQWGTLNYVAPFGIREWPAHGNVAQGQAVNLANFVDGNNNGIYEPYLGDYPAIYGDKCILTIQHAIDPLVGYNMEWYNYFHVFDCDVNDAEKNTIFVKSIYMNRGGDVYNAYLTNFSDFDLGYYGDDYTGTNVQNGLIYVYNGDNFDEDGGGVNGFGENIPSMGMQFLKGAKLENDGIDNAFGVDSAQSINGFGFGDGIIDNEFGTLESSLVVGGSNVFPYNDPNSAVGIYNCSQGLYQNGQTQTYGGQGPNAVNVNTRYAYPGTSDSLGYGTYGQVVNSEWSEGSSQNSPGDRRVMGSTGKFSMANGTNVSFLQAFTIAFDTVNLTPDSSSQKLFEYAAILRNEYAQDSTACGNNFGTIETDLSVVEKKLIDFNVYPNPFSTLLNVEGLKAGAGSIVVYNLEGKNLYSKDIIESKETVQLEGVIDGIYLMKITNSGQSIVKKIVKK
ncbi:MAG: T9SS type A sorting domain-containing protein [Flavobacteriia bacterium]|nr:T9SS type A sorting domain-containing protein [Flavobacteriia bacterium]